MSLTIQEVGPRDGLQNERSHLTVEQRAEFVSRLVRAGLRRIEVGSFVSPTAVPQMAGTEQVLERLEQPPADVSYSCLILNRRGYERALAAQVREIHMTFAVTEAFNRRNQRATPEESLGTFLEILGDAKQRGIRCTLTLAAAFGCPFSGRVDEGQVVEFAARAGAAGIDEIFLADTIGVGVPTQVTRLVRAVLSATGGTTLVGCHFHNTRNTGLANAYAAIEAEVAVLDSTVGGLGGCPFAPAASGNIATEDLVYMAEGMGISTGLNLELLIETARWLEQLLGHRLEGMVMKAGPF